MSNVTTLQSNYNIITNNNLTIDDILETINNLPEAGSGEEDLTTVLESHDTAITTQETTIDNIISALQGKASGGSSGGLQEENVNVTLTISSQGSAYCPNFSYIKYKNGSFITQSYQLASTSYTETLSVAKGSYFNILPGTKNTPIMTVVSCTDGIKILDRENTISIIAQVNDAGTLSVSCTPMGSND